MGSMFEMLNKTPSFAFNSFLGIAPFCCLFCNLAFVLFFFNGFFAFSILHMQAIRSGSEFDSF